MSTRSSTTEINWSFNCLTSGVHNGRPEAIWNLPLFQAAYMFGEEELKELVITRIYQDAMQLVEFGDESQSNITTPEWAEALRDRCEERYLDVLRAKINEISRYYTSPEWKRSQQEVVRRLKKNKLNPGYQPRHSHDSINLLCRILGVSNCRAAS